MLSIIINHVGDMATYRVYMAASPSLRSIYMKSFRADDATFLLANNETESANVEKSKDMAGMDMMRYNSFERSEP